MAAPETIIPMSYEEYLPFSAAAELKHDYVDGCARERAVEPPLMSAIPGPFACIVAEATRGRRVQAYNSNVRVHVAETGASFYPDLSVVCDHLEVDPTDPLSIINPTLLMEVIGPAAEVYDREVKAAHYRRIPSLQEYVLVSPMDRTIEVQRRTERGTWELHLFEAGQVAKLESLGAEVPVDALFVDPLAAAEGG